MRLKIIFFPFALLLSLIIGILYIQPEISHVMSLYAEKQALDQKESNLQTSADNVAPLAQTLDTGASSERSVLNRYFPQQADGEVIVDSLGLLASQSGIALDSLTSQSADVPVATAPPVTEAPAPSAALDPNISLAAPAQETAAPPVMIRTLVVNATGKGSYQGIKDFLRKVAYTNRFNAITKVSIAQASTTGGSADTLGFGAEIAFSFLPKVTDFRNASADATAPSVFSKQTVDTTGVKSLTDFLARGSSIVPEMVPVDGTGRANPFAK